MLHHPRRLLLAALTALALMLAGCATPIDSRPVNAPVQAQRDAPPPPTDIVGEHVVGLSFSGGGLRAAAFAFGVLQALGQREGNQPALLDDIGFISSVSGGSLAAAYYGLHGPAMLQDFRAQVLLQDMEQRMLLSAFSPSNLLRLLNGGLNDRSNLADWLDRDVFKGATFADLHRRRKPDIWINATDVYNRTPFVFSPAAFEAICSDLSSFKVAEAVHASMAVPLVFAPVVLESFPKACATPLPDWVTRVTQEPGASRSALAVAQAVQNYRDPSRQRYLKLVDGGVTDNYGLTSIVVGRAAGGTPHAPLTARDAVQVRRMLFLVVDAGRSPSGDWALQPEGPSAVDMALAATDSAIDSATRVGFEVFRSTLVQWQADVQRFRCGLSADAVQALRGPAEDQQPWDCRDVQFDLGVVSFNDLGPARAAQLNQIPTRLTLPAADIDAAVAAGRDAALRNAALQRYRATRGPVSSQIGR